MDARHQDRMKLDNHLGPAQHRCLGHWDRTPLPSALFPTMNPGRQESYSAAARQGGQVFHRNSLTGEEIRFVPWLREGQPHARSSTGKWLTNVKNISTEQ
jgi:hypothetical protein